MTLAKRKPSNSKGRNDAQQFIPPDLSRQAAPVRLIQTLAYLEMVTFDPRAQSLFRWLGAPAVVLAIAFLLDGSLALASMMMLAMASAVIAGTVLSRFSDRRTAVFAEIDNETLVVKPLAYLRVMPIRFALQDITNIRECGEPGNRKIQIEWNSQTFVIDLKRMLGVAYKRPIEDEFLEFLETNVMPVEHVFSFDDPR